MGRGRHATCRGAVGGNLRRWVILAIALLTSIVVAILVSLIVLPYAVIGAVTR